MTLAVAASNLEKKYRNGVRALRGVHIEVRQGDFFALLGPNGAGKSTLINVLTSLVIKTGGQVSIMGYDIDKNFALARSCIGVVPQEFNFSIFETVETILLNQAGYYGVSRRIARLRAEKYLKQLHLWDKRKSVSRTLSGGMKRRLMIARALMHEPQVLILDEPTAGVDIEIRRTMWDFLAEINRQGVTIILTTHYLEEAENLCRNIAIIDHGEIVTNTSMSALLQQLDHECFILYLQQPMQLIPQVPGYSLKKIDDLTIEVEVPKDLGLSHLFTLLERQGLNISSMRNKRNRLEELFVSLTQPSQEQS